MPKATSAPAQVRVGLDPAENILKAGENAGQTATSDARLQFFFEQPALSRRWTDFFKPA